MAEGEQAEEDAEPALEEFEGSEEEAAAEFDLELESEEEPDWLEDAASACSFSLYPGNPAAGKAGHAP